MNVNEMLSEIPSSPNQEAAGGSLENGKAAAAANLKKAREERDLAKARLSDQNFDISYPDPLLPRTGISPRRYPGGNTAETEQRLMALIAEIQTTSSV